MADDPTIPEEPGVLESVGNELYRTANVASTEILALPANLNSLGGLLVELVNGINPNAKLDQLAQRIYQGSDEYIDKYVEPVTNMDPRTFDLKDELIGTIATSLIPTPIPAVKAGADVATRGYRAIAEIAEMIVPTTVARGSAREFAGSAAANMAVGSGLIDVVRSLNDEQTIGDTLRGVEDKQERYSGMKPEDVHLQMFLDDANEGLNKTEAEVIALGDQTEVSPALAGATLAAVASVIAGRWWLRQGRSAKSNVRSRPKPDDGLRELTAEQTLRAQITDPERVVAEAASPNKYNVDALLDEFDTHTKLGGAAMARSYAYTGRFPGVDYSTAAPMDVARRINALDAQRKQMFHDGMLSGDELVARMSGSGSTQVASIDKVLHDHWRRMMADPELKMLHDEYNQITNGILRYLSDMDVISKDFASKLKANQIPTGHGTGSTAYLPRYALQDEKRGLKRFLDTMDEARLNESHFNEIENFLKSEARPAEVLDPASALLKYTQNAVQFAQRNAMQRKALDGMVLNGYAKRGGKLGAKDAVTIRSGAHGTNGRLTYTIDDPTLQRAVSFYPSTLSGMSKYMDAMRRGFQAGTTGVLNPLFAVRSFVYDIGTAQLGVLAGNVPGSRLQNITDAALMPAHAVRGVAGDLVDKASHEMSSYLKAAQIGSNIPGVKAFANSTAGQNLQNKAATRYLHSVRNRMQSRGVSNIGLMDDAEARFNTTTRELLAEAGPNAVRQFSRLYFGILDSIHQGARFGIYKSRIKPGMSPAELRKLDNAVRHLSIDFSKKGVGKQYGKFAAAVPYGNVTVQGTRWLVNTMKNNPAWFTVAATASTMPYIAAQLYNAENMSPEQRDYYFNRMPMWEKSSRIHIAQPGGGERDFIALPVVPEIVPFNQVALAALESMGIPIHDEEFATPGYDDIREAMSSLINFGLPPGIGVPVAAGTAAFGSPKSLEINIPPGPDDDLIELRDVSKQHDRYHPKEDYAVRNGHIAAGISNVINTALGTAGRFFVDMAETGMQGGDLGAELQQQSAKQLVPGGPALWGEPVEYAGGPRTTEYYTKKDGVEQLRQAFEIMQQPPMATPLQRIVNPDPEVQSLILNAEAYFSGVGSVWSETVQEVSRLREDKLNTRANKSMDPAIRQQILNGIAKQESESYGVLNQLMKDFEQETGIKLDALPNLYM